MDQVTAPGQMDAIQALLAALLADALANGRMRLKWESAPGVIARLATAGLTVRAETISTDFGRLKENVLIIDNLRVVVE